MKSSWLSLYHKDAFLHHPSGEKSGDFQLKIAQVNVYYNPFFVGGAEWYVHNISRRLVKMGHEVHVFTARKYLDQVAPSEEEIEGVKIHRFPFKLNFSYRLKVWDGLSEGLSSQKFDVIHAYDYAQSHDRSALKVGRKTHTPVVLTVFDVHSQIPRPFYKQIPMRLLEKLFAKKALTTASKLLVRAPNLILPLEKMGAKKENIIVTPSGINEDSLSSFDGNRFLKEYNISGSPIILFLGRLNPLKGPQHLLKIAPDVLREFPDSHFVFVGPDQSGYSEELKKITKSARLDTKVTFTGPIYDFTKKMEAYSSCDLFVLPTSYEGTSQAIFEAMSQAKPIVSTNVGGIPSQIENEKEGVLVSYADETALESSVIRLLRDRKLAQELGENALSKVRSFTYPELAARIEGIYESVAGNT